MTTMIEQADGQAGRARSEVEEFEAQGQPSTAGVWMAVLIAIVSAVAVVVLVAVIWGLRPRSRPRTAEELLLERSRETFDRSRDALEALVARLAPAIEW